MNAAAAFFYIYSGIAIASAFMVVASRNPVHSVLFLILTFVNAAGLFVLLGAEFLAMLLVVVYVGAVMVLFLFVVMMLDVDFAELRQGFQNYLPLGLVMAGVMLVELVGFVTFYLVEPGATRLPTAAAPASGTLLTNTEALGRVLYTQYVYYFQAAGLVLLVAMLGAIVLTLRHKAGVKRQDIAAQVARTKETAMEVKKVPFRQGV
jgi:NADH-quinone oxidoreductase subunit J